MSAVETARDALFGNPPDPNKEPSREGMLAAITELAAAVQGAVSAATPYATVAALPASTNSGRIYLVTSDPTTANNGYWQDQSGGNVILTQLNAALKGAPGLMVAASDAQAIARALTTVSLTPANLTALGLTGPFVTSTQGVIGSVSASDRLYYFGKQIDRADGDQDGGVNSIVRSGDQSIYEVVPRAQFKLGSVTQSATDRYYYLGREIRRASIDLDMGVNEAEFIGAKRAAPKGKPGIACMGDSLTEATALETPFPFQLATLTGRDVFNGGYGGQTSKQISERYGGYAVGITVSGNQLVAGSNSVTALNGNALVSMASSTITNDQFLSSRASNRIASCTGFLGSVHGTLTRTATGGPPSTSPDAYTFVPDTGSVLPAYCPAGTPFLIDNLHDQDTQVWWVGRNDFANIAQVQASRAAMWQRSPHKRVVIMGIINQFAPSEFKGGADYNTIVADEASCANLYPGNFLNIRRLIIDRALADLAITPTTQDTWDIGQDIVPWSCRTTLLTTTTSAAIDASQTTIALTSVSNLIAGMLLRIDDEFVLIGGVSGSTITGCTRGYGGSTAATHASGAAALAKDPLHLNTATYGFIATQVRAFINRKGW